MAKKKVTITEIHKDDLYFRDKELIGKKIWIGEGVGQWESDDQYVPLFHWGDVTLAESVSYPNGDPHFAKGEELCFFAFKYE